MKTRRQSLRLTPDQAAWPLPQALLVAGCRFLHFHLLKSISDIAGPFLLMVGMDRYFPTDKGRLGRCPSQPRRRSDGISAPPSAHRSPCRASPGSRSSTSICQISAYLFEFVQTYLMQWTGQKIMFDLRRDIFRHMQRMHVGFFDTHAVGRLVTRITSDVDAINEMFTGGILAIVDDFFTLTFMAIVMLKIKWWLALLAFSVLPLILIVTRMFRNSVRESYRRVRAAIARINSFTQEHVSGMSVVQLFNREQRAYKDFEAVNRLHMIAFKDTIFAYALYYPAVEILSSIAIALVIWRGGFGVLSRLRHHRHAGDVQHVFAALLAADSGSQRQVQHPAGRDGRMRADLQAARYGAGDRQPCESADPATDRTASSSATSGSPIRS